ncbi:MAG: nuclear transport factor 2 family protein [Nitrososphaera sp.]|nr:nuclear transport factor 2 family protein [Nitrososphaera sp.]MCI0707078.1 nuclear transport factor 2 family protein [Ignavibacteriota bacterium]
MRRPVVAVFVLVLSLTGLSMETTARDGDADAIREVVVLAYVNGIHRLRDSVAVRSGFHPTFVMSIRTSDGVQALTLDAWLQRLKLDGKPNPKKVEYKILNIDAVGNTGTVKLELSIDGKLTFTDFLSLYRFPDGWRIVNKVFERH